MRYLIEYHQTGQPPSRWRAFWQQVLAWVILVAFAAITVTLAIFFFSVVASIVAALLIIGALTALVFRLRYGPGWWWRVGRKR